MPYIRIIINPVSQILRILLKTSIKEILNTKMSKFQKLHTCLELLYHSLLLQCMWHGDDQLKALLSVPDCSDSVLHPYFWMRCFSSSSWKHHIDYLRLKSSACIISVCLYCGIKTLFTTYLEGDRRKYKMVNKVKKVSATLFEFKKPTSVSAELLRAHKHPVRNFNYSDMNYKLKLSLFQQVH